MNKIKLLYSSNAFWANSGYGIQGRSLLPRLSQLESIGGKENIAQFAWYGSQGGIHEINGFRIYPAGTDPYGNDILDSHAKHFGANVVVTLIDAWVLQNTAQKVAPALWLPWLPVDHDPVPEKVIEALQGAYLPLSYSQHGHNALLNQGIPNKYIPHGIEPSIFKILQDSDVQAFKNTYFPFHGHLTSMVAANKGFPDRKSFQVQVRAWAEFAKDKSDVRLYLHTEPTPLYQGLDLHKLIAALDITDKVFFPNRYENYIGLPQEYLTFIYNCSNVLMAASMGEGFGIPIIEAQACGTPVITTNFTSMPELIHYGYITEPRDIFWTPMNSWQAWPDHVQIKDALEDNYTTWKSNNCQKDENRGKQAQEDIYALYDWDICVKHWEAVFQEIFQKFNPEELKVAPKKIGKI